ncbi:MAG: type II and III secretion system protein [Candidatus Saganbacteria bacterium]|uniref:Type II and III secretion system protein n=1 Tax=Candidatus Saganbacteria bacterium TaxID=2575572 RepID=A0A833L1W1_UNCSA|nr:MAG: type II and III secretion system protein [Candidatus Saganbacteria bacterium]
MLKKIIPLLILLSIPVLAGEINFQDANISDVAQILAKQAGLNIVMNCDSPKKTSIHLTDMQPEEALEYILRANGYNYEKKGNVVLVSTLPQDISQTAYKGISRIVKLKYISAEKASALMAKIFTGITAISGARSNNLVIRGKESDIDEAEKLLSDIDQPIPQVLIEAKVVEMSESDTIRFGIDHNSGIFKFINGKKQDIDSTLNTLLGNGKANLLATPRISTLDNSEATINIGSRIPYAVPVSSGSASTQWTVDYIDAGVKLKITPQIGQGNQITTFIQPEVSSISEWRTTSAGEFPVISTRNASATVKVKTGETIVVGGLMSESDRVNVTRIPILGHIPILNFFFQNRTVEKAKTEIVFLITPYVVN